MATISNDDVEIEARVMLRERIERTVWFHHGMTEEQRREAIEQDVDRHWPLLVPDAARCLVDRVAQGNPNAYDDPRPASGDQATRSDPCRCDL